MCGIIGYTGPKELVGLLLDGLATLEYRGYDSAGIAVARGGEVRVLKRAGKLRELRDHVASEKLPPYTESYGLGHTRWATHGAPNEVNAHPHRDCTGDVLVIHNGIIENFAELKEELSREGHRFVTETDTEVAAHLVERELRAGEGGLAQAVRRALLRLRGAYALVVASPREPGLIVAGRNGPPLVVGFGDGEGFVASDIPALLPHTRDVAALGDGEMAVVTRERLDVLRVADGTPAAVQRLRIDWDVTAAEKGGHPNYMIKEIWEQPQALRETVLSQVSRGRDEVLLPESVELQSRLGGIRDVTLVACGGSWHAALVGKYYIEQLARLPVIVDVGSEYRYRQPVVDGQSLVVFVTQSGETADTLAALREARRIGALTLAITNVQGSMATREAHASIVTKAGPEIGVASTKTFTAQIATLYLLALALGRRRGVLSSVASHLNDLLQLPHLVEQGLALLEAPVGAGGSEVPLSALARRYASARDCLFLGRGIAYPLALEGALKLKEISYVHGEGYPAGEMKHGPIALIDEHMPVVALVPAGPLREKMLGSVQEARARGGIVLAVGERGDRELARVAQHLIEIPRTPELLAPILLAIPMQLFAYHVAMERGCDVDQPRNLAKSVTVE